jgi:hypothetical protein
MNAIYYKNLAIRPSNIMINFFFQNRCLKFSGGKDSFNITVPVSKLTPAAFEGNISLVKDIAEKSMAARQLLLNISLW